MKNLEINQNEKKSTIIGLVVLLIDAIVIVSFIVFNIFQHYFIK